MTTPDDAAVDPERTNALMDTLTSAYAEMVARIRHDPDKRRAYADATRLADVLRTHANATADLRAMMATEIIDREQLSLTGLAEIFGVSKQRANQLVQAGRRAIAREEMGS